MSNLADIARICRVSTATVSLALRGNPHVALATRQRVVSVATKLGYRPNPLVSAYQSSVRRRSSLAFRGTLGIVNDYPTAAGLQQPIPRQLIAGARIRAETLGYGLDEVHLPCTDINAVEEIARQFTRIFHARGIHGLLFIETHMMRLLARDWSDFAVVSSGREGFLEKRAAPKFEHLCYHHAEPDYYGNFLEAVRQVKRRGFRRIGLCSLEFLETSVRGLWGAGLHVAQSAGGIGRIPPFFRDNPEKGGLKEFRTWLEKHRPDVILTNNAWVRDDLAKLGRSVPEEIALVHVNRAPDEVDWAGIDPRFELLGSFLVDLLVAQVSHGERGMPPHVKKLLVAGNWVDGATCPKALS